MEPISASPLVRLCGVQKRYATGTLALEGLSFSVTEGEFVSLLGPSGCGKSTALRLIGGLASPTSGAIERSWDTQKQRRRAVVGCVFQEPTLLPWTNVWRNVYLPLRLQGVSKQDAWGEIEESLRRVGLLDFANAYPRELSGGMQMRAAVARALVTKPRLLLLDEPFAALDEITRFRLNDDLLTLRDEQGFASLFVTHSVYESVFLSSRVLVLSARPGRVIEEIVVDLPRPRTEATRSSPEYLELCRQASAALRRAMQQEETGAA